MESRQVYGLFVSPSTLHWSHRSGEVKKKVNPKVRTEDEKKRLFQLPLHWEKVEPFKSLSTLNNILDQKRIWEISLWVFFYFLYGTPFKIKESKNKSGKDWKKINRVKFLYVVVPLFLAKITKHLLINRKTYKNGKSPKFRLYFILNFSNFQNLVFKS